MGFCAIIDCHLIIRTFYNAVVKLVFLYGDSLSTCNTDIQSRIELGMNKWMHWKKYTGGLNTRGNQGMPFEMVGYVSKRVERVPIWSTEDH